MQLIFNFDAHAPSECEATKEEIQFPEIPSAKQLQCDAKLSELAQNLSFGVGSYSVGSRVTVWWNPRLQTTAGTADSRRNRIDLNPKLAPLGASVVDRILRHELAHLIAINRNKFKSISPHGKEWKEACADLDIPGEKASHSLPLSTAHRARYMYRCSNCEQVVKRVRKMSANLACYACCRKHNGGKYHADFIFERMAAPVAQGR